MKDIWDIIIASIVSIDVLCQLLFIILKICSVLTWSWLWILSPVWITVVLIILILAWVGIQLLGFKINF
jgi:hypothetical protein